MTTEAFRAVCRTAALLLACVVPTAGNAFAQGSISGQVTDAGTGLPLPGVWMQVYDADGNFVVSVASGPAGEYVASGIPAGDVFVRTFNPLGYVDELYDGFLCVNFCEPLLGTAVAVPAAGTVSGIDVALARGGQVAGRVTDAVSGAGLSGVFVQIRNASGNFQFTSATTDAAGNYLVETGLPPGSYVVRTSNQLGYIDELHDDVPCLTASCPTASATPVTVTAGATAAVDFALDAGGRFAGVVTEDGSGAPLPDLFIQVYNAAGQFVTSMRTDAGGAYLTPRGLPTGIYFARVSGGGYVGELFGGQACVGFCTPTRGAPIAVTTGATTSGIDFALARGGQVAGVLTDETTGLPIAFSSVFVASGSGSQVASGFSDATGAYVTDEGLPSGSYFVFTGNSDGYLNEVHDDTPCIGCSPTVGDPVAVTAGAVTSGIDFALGRGGRLAGTVTAAGGGPLAGVQVEVRNAAGTFITSVTTDAAGRYLTHAGLLPGGYHVSTFNDLGYVNEAFGDVPCPAGCAGLGTPAMASLGVTTTGIDVELAAGGRVEGTITDAGTGLAVPDVSLNVLDDLGRFVSFARSDALGRYRSGAGVATGTVFARTSNQLGYVNEMFDDVTCASFCPVAVGTPIAAAAGSTTTDISFALDRGGRITGTVRDATTGVPLPNVNVQATDSSETIFVSGTTDAAGQYAIAGLPAGSYYVRTSNTVGYLDELHDGIGCFGGCPVTSGTPVAVALGATVGGLDFELERGGRVSGVVTDAVTGLALVGARVSLLDPSGRILASAVTDISGAYLTGTGVRTGTYHARTSNTLGYIDELYDDVACVGGCTVALGTAFTVTAGTTRSGIDFALSAGGRISGTVTDEVTGAGIGDTSVLVFDASGRFAASASPDGAGNYLTGAGLPTGTYFLYTSNFAGYIDELYDGHPCLGGSCTPVTGTPVSVTAGAVTVGIHFGLARGARIAGRVLDAATSLPASDVSIDVYDATGRFVSNGFSNVDGRYETSGGLPPGTYFARARSFTGYVSQLYDALPCLGSCNVTLGTPIVVSGTGGTSGIDFELTAGGRVAGRVLDAITSAPLVGVTVIVSDAAGAVVTSASTNSAGQYLSRDGLPTGTYHARTSNGLGYVNGLYDGLSCVGGCNVTAGTGIGVTLGAVTPGIDFALATGARVSGHVEKSTGGGLSNALVSLHDAGGTLLLRAATDGLGNFLSRDGVPSGTYYARTENSQGFVNQVYSGFDCLASCDPTSGTPLTLLAGSVHGSVDFTLTLDTDLDGDGIAATVDRDAATGADESATPSDDFNDVPLGGTTSGTVTDRGGFTVRVDDVSPGGVRASALGSGVSPAVLSVCDVSGPEGLLLDVAGETADVACTPAGTAAVRAVVATSAIQLRKPVTGPATVVDLTTGQAARMGSPVVAEPSNTEPILVRFVDGAGATFGSLELDPGESVETNVTGPGAVEVAVLAGLTTVTVGAETVTLGAGESHTFGSVAPALDALIARIDVLVAEGKIRNKGIGNALKVPLLLARSLAASHPAAAVRALRLELVLLDLFALLRQITPDARAELRPAVVDLIAALS